MKRLKESYVGYLNNDNIKCGVKIKVLHSKLDPRNMNKLDHVRYVSNAFAYMLSLLAYWSDRNNRHESTVIISDEQLADNIGCHPKHSYKVINKLQEIFNLDIRRLPEKGGAREITINERVIEFLKIYNESDFYNFIDKYNLTDKKCFKALQQLYRYRAWGVKDTQLNVSELDSKQSFLKKFKNFFHRVITSNRSDYSRIDFIKANKQFLSSLNVSQLDRIIEEKKQGELSHYWSMILINLEQKVSANIKTLERKNNKQEQEPTSHVNRESNLGETEAHASATRVAQKDPEDNHITPGEVIDILIKFNNMILDQDIPEVTSLNQSVINSIDSTVKSIGKKEVISAINKVSILRHDTKYTKMTFKRFMKPETIKMIHKMIDTEDIESPSWMAKRLQDMGYKVVQYIDPEATPELTNYDEVITYWNQLKA